MLVEIVDVLIQARRGAYCHAIIVRITIRTKPPVSWLTSRLQVTQIWISILPHNVAPVRATWRRKRFTKISVLFKSLCRSSCQLVKFEFLNKKLLIAYQLEKLTGVLFFSNLKQFCSWTMKLCGRNRLPQLLQSTGLYIEESASISCSLNFRLSDSLKQFQGKWFVKSIIEIKQTSFILVSAVFFSGSALPMFWILYLSLKMKGSIIFEYYQSLFSQSYTRFNIVLKWISILYHPPIQINYFKGKSFLEISTEYYAAL